MLESGNIAAVVEPAMLEALFVPALRTTAALTRLDERLRKSPIREGYLSRMAFHDAVASLWLSGELVHLEDLVLHDAHMDIRAPTHELTLAHQVLRAIRQVAANTPDWALSQKGLQSLRRGRSFVENLGQDGDMAGGQSNGKAWPPDDNTISATSDDALDDRERAEAERSEPTQDVSFAKLEFDRDLADMDARLKRLNAVLQRTSNRGSADAKDNVGHAVHYLAGNSVRDAASSDNGLNPLIYDDDDAEERLSEWQTRLTATRDLPQVLRAALALDDWNQNDVVPRAPWLGSLLAASMLRGESKQSGKASGQGFALAHLSALFMGLRQIPRERRNAKDQNVRLIALMEAFEQSAFIGLKEHDRLVLARTQMQRKLKGKRANSKLPQLIDLVLSRPLVTSTMIERELKVTLQGALNLVAELGLREVTGRGRYRAWAVA
jgi:Protein of unknown function (DUF1612)/HTH DNA binding domain